MYHIDVDTTQKAKRNAAVQYEVVLAHFFIRRVFFNSTDILGFAIL